MTPESYKFFKLIWTRACKRSMKMLAIFTYAWISCHTRVLGLFWLSEMEQTAPSPHDVHACDVSVFYASHWWYRCQLTGLSGGVKYRMCRHNNDSITVKNTVYEQNCSWKIQRISSQLEQYVCSKFTKYARFAILSPYKLCLRRERTCGENGPCHVKNCAAILKQMKKGCYES